MAGMTLLAADQLDWYVGKTNVIYVKNFSLQEYPDEPAVLEKENIEENETDAIENTRVRKKKSTKKEPEKPENTQKFEK